MFVLVVGGGKVGYYLTKELIESGPRGRPDGEGPRRARTRSRTRSAPWSSPRTAARASTSREAGANRADIVAAVTGDDEDNLVICQMAKHHFDVPRTIARVNNPKNERAVPAPRRGRDHQPHADDPRLHRAGHPGPRAAPPRGARRRRARDHRGAPPAGLAGHRAGRDGPLDAPGLLAVRGHPRGRADAAHADTVLAEGDKVIAIGRPDCEAQLREQLIGAPDEA